MSDQMILTPYFLDALVPDLRSLAGADWDVLALPLPDSDRLTRMTLLHAALAESVAAAVQRGARPVSLAGDCCTTLGVLAGLQRAGIRPKLIWFDAHGDFNTWETTPSGFLGGMPLAMLVGRGDLTLAQGVGLTLLPETDVILTDARDLDPGERLALAASALTHLPDVAALRDAPLPDGPLWVHFDVDVLRLEDAPAMSYPAVGGPSADTMRAVFRRLAQTGRVAAVSVSAWNPDLDSDGRSRALSLSLLAELLG